MFSFFNEINEIFFTSRKNFPKKFHKASSVFGQTAIGFLENHHVSLD